MNESMIAAQLKKYRVVPLAEASPCSDELYVTVKPVDLTAACRALHRHLNSPVMTFFAVDERKAKGCFDLYCAFEGISPGRWVFVTASLPGDEPRFATLARDIFSASLFEREILEMFGIEPLYSPDDRRLRLHDEVWPSRSYPLRKDFSMPGKLPIDGAPYHFRRIEGEGVFEVPVGPVHAGIIAPGHFRFSVAGEPIINLEIRLGFAHRGVEKLFEGKTFDEAAALAECVSGDAAFAHSLALCTALEKIEGVTVPKKAQVLRAIFLELERMYNHAAGIGGIAVDVGFSFPQAFASIMKETLLQMNERLTGSRYLKGVNRVGGVTRDIADLDKTMLLATVNHLNGEMAELKKMLFESVSFMDRADTTGTLAQNIAEDLGITGLAGRASGIDRDLRRDFPGVYEAADFRPVVLSSGDVLARLKVRIGEFEESVRLIHYFATQSGGAGENPQSRPGRRTSGGHALGFVESWRGPVLYWLKTDCSGRVERCKVTDPSFRNWMGLAYAVQGNIIPDFPLCNKSFDLSYSGNDL